MSCNSKSCMFLFTGGPYSLPHPLDLLYLELLCLRISKLLPFFYLSNTINTKMLLNYPNALIRCIIGIFFSIKIHFLHVWPLTYGSIFLLIWINLARNNNLNFVDFSSMFCSLLSFGIFSHSSNILIWCNVWIYFQIAKQIYR